MRIARVLWLYSSILICLAAGQEPLEEWDVQIEDAPMEEHHPLEFNEKLQKLLPISEYDTFVVKATEACDQPARKDNSSQCVLALLDVFSLSRSEDIRSLALKELHVRVVYNSLLNLVSQSDRVRIVTNVVEHAFEEPAVRIREQAAYSSVAIVSQGLREDKDMGPNVLSLLRRNTGTSSTQKRATAASLLSRLLGITWGNYRFSQSVDAYELLDTVKAHIEDPDDVDVRLSGVKSFTAISLDLGTRRGIREYMQPLAPSLIELLDHCIQTCNPKSAETVLFDVQALVDRNIIRPELVPGLIKLLMEHGSNPKIDARLRDNILYAVSVIVRAPEREDEIAENMLPYLMDTLHRITEGDQHGSSKSAARRFISWLNSDMERRRLLSTVPGLPAKFYASTSTYERQSTMLSLREAVGKATSSQTDSLITTQIWEMIQGGLRDSDVAVKEATCRTLSYICSSLSTGCAPVGPRADLIPLLLDLANDVSTADVGLAALSQVLDRGHAPFPIRQHLHTVVRFFNELLVETESESFKSYVINILGNIALTSGPKFLFHLQSTMDIFTSILAASPTIQNRSVEDYLRLDPNDENLDEDLAVRLDVIYALGAFATAVGKPGFAPYFTESIHAVFRVLGAHELGDQALESIYSFLAVMWQLFEAEMAPHTTRIMKPILALCDLDIPELGDPRVQVDVVRDPAQPTIGLALSIRVGSGRARILKSGDINCDPDPMNYIIMIMDPSSDPYGVYAGKT